MPWVWLAYWMCLVYLQPQQASLYRFKREGTEWCYDKPQQLSLTVEEESLLDNLGMYRCGLSYMEDV